MWYSKLDIKTILLLIFGGILVFMIFFKETPIDSTYKEKIELLEKDNKLLLESNKLLKEQNDAQDQIIIRIDKDIRDNNNKLVETDKELEKLKKRRYETSIYVNDLSAGGVVSSLSEYLERTKGSNVNQPKR